MVEYDYKKIGLTTMRCISPIKASQNSDGDIVYSNRKALPGLVGFEFECRKCLPCRLNIAREKAIRCVHEAQMHEGNIFLTLTYNDESLASERLIYEDFQKFMKLLREKVLIKAKKEELLRYGNSVTSDKELRNANYISYMVTGEYGEINKRPHWHAILFNYYPDDAEYKYTTDHGEKVYTSEELEKIWKKGNLEFGSVTMDSAGYVARYAAKKLVHGKDQEHDYHPIHKTSSQRAIGRSWIERYWQHTFENGFVVLQNGQTAKIPRYYVDWLKKYRPKNYIEYCETVREEVMLKAEKQARKEEMEYLSNLATATGHSDRVHAHTRQNVKLRILKSKFKKLTEHMKL